MAKNLKTHVFVLYATREIVVIALTNLRLQYMGCCGRTVGNVPRAIQPQKSGLVLYTGNRNSEVLVLTDSKRRRRQVG